MLTKQSEWYWFETIISSEYNDTTWSQPSSTSWSEYFRKKFNKNWIAIYSLILNQRPAQFNDFTCFSVSETISGVSSTIMTVTYEKWNTARDETHVIMVPVKANGTYHFYRYRWCSFTLSIIWFMAIN